MVEQTVILSFTEQLFNNSCLWLFSKSLRIAQTANPSKNFFFKREKKKERIQKITTEAEKHKLSLRGSAVAHSAISQKELQPCASDTQKCTVCLQTIACTQRSSRAVNASHCCPAEMVLSWLGGLGELEAPGGKKAEGHLAVL